MAQIFISYSRKDTKIVDSIHKKLSESGFDIWLDSEDVQGGDLWRRQIVEGISSCLAFVIVLSPNSVQSNNVRKELDIAEGKGRKIYPVMISTVSIPSEMEYQLAGVQIVDLVTNMENGLNRLVESLSIAKTPKPSMSRPVKSKQSKTSTGTIRLIRLNPKGYVSGKAGNYGVWVDNKKAGAIA